MRKIVRLIAGDNFSASANLANACFNTSSSDFTFIDNKHPSKVNTIACSFLESLFF